MTHQRCFAGFRFLWLASRIFTWKTFSTASPSVCDSTLNIAFVLTLTFVDEWNGERANRARLDLRVLYDIDASY